MNHANEAEGPAVFPPGENAVAQEQERIEAIAAGLVPWFQDRMPGASGILVSGIQKPGMGLSNETYLFDLAWEEGGRRHEKGLVLRCPPADHRVFPDYHLSHQYRIMKALEGSPVPVPAMWGFEERDDLIGRPFYVMERLQGTMPKDYPSYHGSGMLREMAPGKRRALWWDSLSVMTEIHRTDWRSAGLDFLGAPRGGTDPVDRQID